MAGPIEHFAEATFMAHRRALETAPTDTDNAVLIAAVIGDTFADD